MLRIILGIIAGFIVWSILWVGVDAVLTALSPDWYGKYISELHKAAAAGQPFSAKTGMSFMALILSCICSIAAGYAAVWIAKESAKTPLILGVLLLITGLAVEIAFWKYLQIWYHFLFLILLIPMTIVGGKLKKQTVKS